MSTDSTYLRPGAPKGASLVAGGNILRADRPLVDLGSGPALARSEQPNLPARGNVLGGNPTDTDFGRQPSWR